MKKLFTGIFAILYIILSFMTFSPRVDASTWGVTHGGPAWGSTEGKTCYIGSNITNKITNPTLDMYIEGVDLNAYNNTGEVSMIRKDDSETIQQWDYVVTSITGALENKGRRFHEGDYFILDLPKGARVGGLTHQSLVKIDDIYIVDPATNEEVLFASAKYDAENSKIYYFLSDFIEDKDGVEFSANSAWTLKESYALYNNAYDFTSKFGTLDITKEFATHGTANDSNYTSMVTNVININPLEQTYEEVGVFNNAPSNTLNGFTVSYYSPRNEFTPLADDYEFRIYEVPDGYKIPDSFYIEKDKLIDVTDNFTKTEEPNLKTVFFHTNEVTSKRYMFYLQNRYELGKDLVTGFDVNGLGSEQRLVASQLPTFANVDNSLPYFCPELTIKKVDKESGDVLAGAKFKITNQETKKEIGTFVTDQYGMVDVKVEYGTYIIQEIESPEGYIINEEPIVFEVVEDKDNTIVIENTPSKPEEPPTKEEPKEPKEPNTPDKPENPKSNTPQTGDKNILIPMIMLMGLSFTLFVVNLKKLNKK